MPVLVPAPANMNYANLIEEKNLKKTFIIATLVSTLVGTFAASHNLYERFTQQKKDGAQDEAIKNLNEKIDKLQMNGGGGGGGNNDQQGKRDELRISLDTSGGVIRREYDYGLDRLGRRFAIGDLITENELQKQVIMLQQTVIRVLEDAMYNNRYIDPPGLDRLLFASRTARNGSLDALRGQYQRLLLELPPAPPLVEPPPPQRGREFIRVAEVQSREPTPAPGSPRRLLGPPPPPQRYLQEVTRVTEIGQGKKPREPAPAPPMPSSSRNGHRTKSNPAVGMDFFCRYSLDLQRTSDMPLSRTFDPRDEHHHPNPVSFPPPARGRRTGTTHCPTCRVSLDVDATDVWEIEIPVFVRDKAESVQRRGRSRSRSKQRKEDVITTTATNQRRREIRRFRIPARFVIKCHTPEGDFVCALCCGPQDGYHHRAGGGGGGVVVVLCEDAEALVDHVAREHRIGDIENEWDIFPG